LKERICIAGSGKMAVNIGLYFLQKEHPVHWLSHSSGQVDAVSKILKKTRKRLEKFLPDQCKTFEAGVSLYGTDIPQPDIILESGRESLRDKRAIFSSLSALVNDHTLLFSNSSSILPGTINPRCIGAHFFFPVELTGLVELIADVPAKQDGYRRACSFFKNSGFDVIEQDTRSAFTTNRLLLPLQAAALGALKKGYLSTDVDTASKSDLISFGQLSLMDSIGLDIVKSAAANYKNLDSLILTPDFDLLINALDQLVLSGKLGAKNKNGLLAGETLPWPVNHKKDNKGLHSLNKQFKQLIEKSCSEALQKKMISKEDLAIVLKRIFHANVLPDDLLKN